MRWVDRGPEPDGVGGYALQFTPGWVDYFRHNIGGRPTDSYWREFRAALGACSGAICWYCERKCESAAEAGGKAATVDHFRPLSRFPELAYEWSNWIFSCQECNGEYKKDKWAGGGYVDPGAGDEQARPEWYFAYDTRTGDIIAHPTLTGETRQRAWDTISDMGLNRLNVQYYRLNWTRQLEADLLQLPSDERNAFAEFVSGRAAEFLGSTRMLIAQMRESGEF